MRSLVLAILVALAVQPAAAAPAMRVAVMEFQAGGGSDADLAALGKGLQSMVTTDLAQVSSLTLVERARMQDIQAELKLGKSGLVDPATAVKIGKLAGATHLVAGSYVVVGGKMRLDARLFSVADGKILLAEQIEGERDAFFELEKQLVGKVIAAVGVAVPPKERAEVARVHTADFDAFRRYSEGVASFDDKKYEDALAALRDAGTRDPGFKLASVTLAEYERVIADIRNKADAIETSRAQVEKLEQDRSIADEAAMVKKLGEIANRPGQAAQVDRLAALHILALIYTGDSRGHHDLLRKVQDDFALRRAAEILWKSYYAEAVSAFPKAPLNPSGELEAALPHPASFDKDFTEFRERMLNFQAGGDNHRGSLIAFGLRVHDLARELLVDRESEAILWARAITLAAALQITPEESAPLELELGLALRGAGKYGESSAVFARLAAREKDPLQLKELAAYIEENREREELLRATRQAPLAREALAIVDVGWNDTEMKDIRASLAKNARPRARDLCVVNHYRMLSEADAGCGRDCGSAYVILEGSPTWMIRGYEALYSGPRTDRFRGRELRYYKESDSSEAMAVIDGVPRKSLAIAFKVDFTPPADWWPETVLENLGSPRLAEPPPYKHARPEVAFAFGIRDVKSDARPLRAYELGLGPDAVRLVELTEQDGKMTRKVVEEKRLELAGALDVRVTLGDKVEVTVNGKSAAFAAPADRGGFYGFAFHGPGYAAVTTWKLEGR
jgi:TolB-like protein